VNKKIRPPFIPKINSDSDTPYVDQEFTNLTPVDSYNAGDSLGNEENPYREFSYNEDNKNLKKDVMDVDK